MNSKVITITFSNPTLRHLYMFHNLKYHYEPFQYSSCLKKELCVISVMFTSPVLSYFNVFHVSSG